MSKKHAKGKGLSLNGYTGNNPNPRLRSRPCAPCEAEGRTVAAHYIVESKGYCGGHKREAYEAQGRSVGIYRASCPSELELALMRELRELNQWRPMTSEEIENCAPWETETVVCPTIPPVSRPFPTPAPITN